MTAEFLAGLAGAILSILFSYIPGLNTWYAKLSKQYQRLIMLASLVYAAGVIYGLSCANILNYITCDKAGLIGLGKVLVAAIVVNQSIYQITVKTPAVRSARLQ
jgi:hypothetical protein